MWRLETFAVDEPLDSVSMVSADEGWAVGSQPNTACCNSDQTWVQPPNGVLLHYSHGAWSVYKP